MRLKNFFIGFFATLVLLGGGYYFFKSTPQKEEIVEVETQPRKSKKGVSQQRKADKFEITKSIPSPSQKRKEPSTKKLSASPSDQKPSAKKGQPKPNIDNEFVAQMLKQAVTTYYSGLFVTLNLDSEAQEKFQNSLQDSFQKQFELASLAFDPSISDEKILSDNEAYREKQKKELEKILSSDEMDVVEEYNRNLPAKILNKTIYDELGFLKDKGEREQLSEVLAELSKEQSQKIFGVPYLTGAPLEQYTPENIKSLRDKKKFSEYFASHFSQESINNKIEAAGRVLDKDQLKMYEKLEKEKASILRPLLDKNKLEGKVENKEDLNN